MKPSANIAQIPLWSLYGRLISDFFLRIFFPRIFIDKTKALKKASLAAKTGAGLVVIFTHFSLRDAMEVNRSIIFRAPVLRNREAVNPLSYHQFNKFMEFMAKFYHGTFSPIVNNSTITKKGYEHLTKGKGLREFIIASSKVLSRGGSVTLAINASRKEKLDLEDKQKPIGYFIASLQALGVKEFGFLLVGFAIKNANSYKKKEVGGMNFGKTYIINIGNYFSLSELLDRPEVKGKLSDVDAFVRNEMAKVVAKEYL